MRNLFIIRTPLQLLTAYIVAQQFFAQAKNDLLLINPRGDQLWTKTLALTVLASDSDVWDRRIVQKHRIPRRSDFLHLRRSLSAERNLLLEKGPIDQVLMGTDRTIDNQILVELAGNHSYIRLEDGVWSYASPRRSEWERFAVAAWLSFIKFCGNLTMKYNIEGGGYGGTATADYLYKPELLKRSSPHVVPIGRQHVHDALQFLKDKIRGEQVVDRKPCILFLGSTLVSQGSSAQKSEVSLLKVIADFAAEHNLDFIYKPHPFEGTRKLDYYKTLLPGIQFLHSPDPVELLYSLYDSIRFVFGHSSSGLLYTDVFAKGITPVALFKLYDCAAPSPLLESMMRETRVEIPNSLQGLKEFLGQFPVLKNF